jgi:hypothetical protein
MDVLKQLLTYAVILALIWAGLTYLPRLARVQLSVDYTDIDVPGVEEYKSYAIDRAVSVPNLRVGDVVCYRVNQGEDAQSNGFGYVVGLPGDSIRVERGIVQVNGTASKFSGTTNLPNSGPLMIPMNHVYVVTSNHMTDSLAKGPLPAAALRGRLTGDFP